MTTKKEVEMITPKEFAELHDVAYTTVVGWLRLDLIEGARKVELPHMKSHVYMVPKDANPPELKPGPKKGSKRAAAPPATEEKPAKPAKKRAGKKATKKPGREK